MSEAGQLRIHRGSSVDERVRAASCALATLVALFVSGCGGGGHSAASVRTPRAKQIAAAARSTVRPAVRRREIHVRRGPYAVGLRVVTFVDRSRVIRLPGRPPEPRRLVTLIRYPAVGRPGATDLIGAKPIRSSSGFPLVVFGHGYDSTPARYAPLLRAWAQSGYIVAAPVFPLENANAPGGPNEADLINQPRDMSFVISRVLALSRAGVGFLAGLVDPRRIAVAGHSDGAETALAVAYDRGFLDRRVRAAVILEGAELPGGAFEFPRPSPPLLATLGTADTINLPRFTRAFFDRAPAPKYLLTMFGTQHVGPYTVQEPQLRIVEHTTTAFLDRYLSGIRGAGKQILADGHVPGISTLTADP
jgi:dienelactone hydrolase